jgi:hypothetical protein
MLRSVMDLFRYYIANKTQRYGKVKDIYFDDAWWKIRYFIVDTTKWLPGKKVLISPDVMKEPVQAQLLIPTILTEEQIKNSPPMEEEQTISRTNEAHLAHYYGWNPWWLIGAGTLEGVPPMLPGKMDLLERGDKQKELIASEEKKEETNLRSMKEIKGYDIQPADGESGRLDDFIVETDDWRLRYFVFDTAYHLLQGKKVLISCDWIERINWMERTIYIDLTQEQIKNGPEFDPNTPINRKVETIIYDYYGKPHYWF